MRRPFPGDGALLKAYDRAWRLFLPLVASIGRLDALIRGACGKGLLPGNWHVTSRLALGNVSGSGSETLWLHCASLGEAKGLWALVRELAAAAPLPFRILTTANTAGGLDFLERQCASLRAGASLDAAPEVIASIAPFDHPGVVGRFLSAHRVRALCLCETELWPNYIRVSADLGIPAMLVSARLSAGALTAYRRFPGASSRVLEKLAWVQTQSGYDRDRFRTLTGRDAALGFDFKAAFHARAGVAIANLPAMPRNRTAESRIAGRRGTKCRLALISLHAEEIRRLLPGLPPLLERFDVSVFPRRLRELPRFRRYLEPLGFVPYSLDPEGANVLVDSMGLVEGILPSCGLAFVGGSLVPRGCHNLWEPLAAGLKTYFGPWYGNQESLAKPMLERGIAEIVRDVSQLRSWSEPGPEVKAACGLLIEEQRELLDAALADFRDRIFVTFKNGPGSTAAVTHSRGREP